MSNSSGAITVSNTYNSRLQPSSLSASANGLSVLSLAYDFHAGNGDNGNVFQIANGKDDNRTQNFSYDKMNRIQQAWTNGPNWGETFTLDPWGNLTNRTAVTGKTNYEPLSAAASTQNQLTGFSYDAAGNLTNNGGAAYTYDGENRLSSAGGLTYVYDGDGNRVHRINGTGGTLDWRDTNGEVLDETSVADAIRQEYIFFNGKRIARHDYVAGKVTYYFSDHLGSASVVTDSTGKILDESDYYPYGGEIVITNNDSNHFKFTGKERDSESGLDMFGARYYGSSLGRFMTPDWATAPTDVPYAEFGSPQSLNLYSYVKNNPTSFDDPDGHCPWCIGAAIGAATGFTASIVVQKWQHPDQAINWKSVGAATLGGAVAGATLGFAAPATLTTLGGTAVVSTAGVGETAAVGAAGGVAGGIAERTVENNGDVDKAMENPNAIARDAAIGGGGEVVNQAVGAAVERAAGGAVSKAEAKVGRLTPESSSSRVKARTAELQRAQSALSTKTEAVKAASGAAVGVADQETRKKE